MATGLAEKASAKTKIVRFDFYAPNAQMVSLAGDFRRKRIYERTCLQCHGARVFPLKGKVLVGGLEYFNRIIAKGTV